MNVWKRWLCLFLAVVTVFGIAIMPVYATNDSEESGISDQMESYMNSSSNSMSFGASGEDETGKATDVKDSVPEETQPEPAETETVPEEEESPVQETKPVIPQGPFPDKSNKKTPLIDSLWGAGASDEDVYNNVPLYFQTDYKDIPYSDGTVATSGCSMASIAMVASYLREEEFCPGELAKKYAKYDASNIQRMECAATVLDLYYEKTNYWYHVIRALENGKVVIVLVDKRTDFTKTQHFLVLTGISADGKIFVNDSYEPNYANKALAEGFADGFEQDAILAGFGEAWIFGDYVEPEVVPTRYPNVNLTDDEKYLMAKIIWLEARGESFQGQQAIAEIILNRLVSDRFPNTIRDVIYAEGQFSTTKFLDTAKPGEIQYKAIECALNRHSVLPMDVYFFGRGPRTSKVWGKIGGHIFCYSEN